MRLPSKQTNHPQLGERTAIITYRYINGVYRAVIADVWADFFGTKLEATHDHAENELDRFLKEYRNG